ncbi:hypothetical protein BDV24DRAFT_127010 [Aspergillus arachidicola]|uniref:Uncharacterized protein n=1 Tax=Aspergillus arachidicola TaxID=656916 RepID=A0A5N6YIH3_9EURO|nr:hypothetical protein BDV24DRAFT_127010 [Aspergillus arachidicola]
MVVYAGCGFEAIRTHVCDAPSYMMTAMHECNLVMHEIFIRKTKEEAAAGKVERTHAANIWPTLNTRSLVQGGESASLGAD